MLQEARNHVGSTSNLRVFNLPSEGVDVTEGDPAGQDRGYCAKPLNVVPSSQTPNSSYRYVFIGPYITPLKETLRSNGFLIRLQPPIAYKPLE